MKYTSMGQLIQTLRKEKGLTQKQLAEMLNITDKAVSKWERDIACPDTTTLPYLADILGVSVESLLNAKTVVPQPDVESGISDDINPDAEMYKERVKQLLLKGLPGFVLGAILFLTMFCCFSGATDSSISWTDKILSGVFISLLGGIALAGVPYGWSLINKFLGQWIICSNILVWVFLFLLKVVAAFAIGCFGYPIVIIYNLIRAQKTKRMVKRWAMIAIAMVVLWYVVIGIYTYLGS